MIKKIYILLFGSILITLVSTGCTSLKMLKDEKKENKSMPKRASSELLSCDKKAKPKTLQYLEQQYRCNTHD